MSPILNSISVGVAFLSGEIGVDVDSLEEVRTHCPLVRNDVFSFFEGNYTALYFTLIKLLHFIYSVFFIILHQTKVTTQD